MITQTPEFQKYIEIYTGGFPQHLEHAISVMTDLTQAVIMFDTKKQEELQSSLTLTMSDLQSVHSEVRDIATSLDAPVYALQPILSEYVNQEGLEDLKVRLAEVNVLKERFLDAQKRLQDANESRCRFVEETMGKIKTR